VAAASLPLFMAVLDNLVVTTALPVMMADLDATLSQLEWTVDAFTLPYAALLLTAAVVGDRWGRRRAFVAGIVLFSVASAACALASDPAELIAARVFQGIGAALVVPLSLTLLLAGVSAERRNVVVGIWGGIAGFGAAVGPVVGGAITEAGSWNWIFWLNVPIGLVSVVLVLMFLGESRGPAVSLDPVGALLSSAGLLALVWSIVDGPHAGWTSTPVLAGCAAAVVMLVAFVVWERHVRSPMLPMALFRVRGFGLVNAAAFLFQAAVFGCIFLFAQYFQVVGRLGPLEAGLYTLPCTLAPAVVAPFNAVLARRFGLRATIVTGHALVVVALGWLALVVGDQLRYAAMVPPMLLAGIGLGLTFSTLNMQAMQAVPPALHGVASGAHNAIRQIGVAVGVSGLAAVFAGYGAYTPGEFAAGLAPAAVTGAVAVAAGAVLAWRLP
jgi:EmrB/QacA subfamily drug resistance transporter